MNYLLDTNVISELRKIRNGTADRQVVTWASSITAANLYLSAITVLELEKGTRQIARRDPMQGTILRLWIDSQVLTAFAGRILSVDTAVAQRCATLLVPNPRDEMDALIAATALVHNMTVITRNTADFEPMNVPVLNPWTSPA